MEFQLLGPLEVRRDGRSEVLSGRLQQVLLGLLLAQGGTPVPVDALTEALWGERPDDRAGQRLQLHVHRLRRLLGEADRLSFGPGGYRLRVLPGELDAERFEAQATEAAEVAGQDPRRAAELLRKALAMWRGTPFAGLDDVPRLTDWAQRLGERRLVALETLYRAELHCGREDAVIPELSAAVREHPLRESLHALLVTALYRAGRRTDALAACRAAREALLAELGLEPGEELRELERRVVAGEPVRPEGAEQPHAARTAPPAQLPADIAGFVGRDAELAELDGLLTEPGPALISAVAGTAGVGKTALAVRWAHRVRERFPDGQLYVDLRGYGPDQPVSPADALAGFLRALGLDGAAIPPDLAERAARFRTLVDRRRMLIVLDNARSVEQVRPLLPGSPSCFTVVTSRDTLAGLVAREGAHRIGLDRLPRDDARRLLRRLLGDRALAEPEPVDTLIQRCARLPLALRIAAEQIRARPGRSIAELAAELARQPDAPDVLDLLDLDGDPHSAVRAVFSWSYRQLGPDVARIFRLIGLHPGQDMDGYAIAALAAGGLRGTRRALDVLLRAHLLDQTPAGRYRPHDLLRAYAAELAAATDSERERSAALDRLLEHYLSTAAAAMVTIAPYEAMLRPPVPVPAYETPPLAGYDHARRWLETEHANLLEATAHGGPRYTIAMSHTIWRHLYLSGSHHDAVLLHSRALAAAVALDEPLAEANARRVLSLALNRTGRTREAIDHLQRALRVYREAGDPALQAAALNNLGVVRSKTGELVDAGRHFEEALELNGPDGSPHLYSLIVTNLARNLRSRGRFTEAGEHLEKALVIAADGGYRITESNAQCILADIHSRAGREAEAFASARRGLAIAREIGHRVLEGAALRVLGTLHQRRGEHERALELQTEALELVRAIGDTELTAETLNSLALTHATAGRPAEALRCHDAALAVATHTGHHEAQALAHLGINDLQAAATTPPPAGTPAAPDGIPAAPDADGTPAPAPAPAPAAVPEAGTPDTGATPDAGAMPDAGAAPGPR